MNPLSASQSTVCGLAWKRYSRQMPLRDVAPALNGRASLAGVRPCRTGAASFMVAGLAHATAQANRGKPARHCEAHSPAGERHGGRASRGRGRHGNEGPGGATAGDDRKMNDEPLEREPIDRVRARLEALLKANAAPRCGA